MSAGDALDNHRQTGRFPATNTGDVRILRRTVVASLR